MYVVCAHQVARVFPSRDDGSAGHGSHAVQLSETARDIFLNPSISSFHFIHSFIHFLVVQL